MKHLCAMVALMGCAFSINAQLIEVQSIERVNTPVSVDQAVISPDGKIVIASTNDDRSLMKIDLTDGKAVKVADNSSTYLLQFTDDAGTIAYVEESEDSNHLRYKAVKTLNLASGAVNQVQAPTRNLNGVATRANKVMVVDDAKMAAVQVNGRANRSLAPAKAAPVAYIHYGELMIDINGESKVLNPNGSEDCSYLWPSISPDGTKVLYYYVGAGTCVCDLDGSNMKVIADIRAPRWLDNETIIAMDDKDDGRFFTASKLIAADLNGKMQVVTNGENIAMYPSVSADASKIAYSTPAGELYIINVKR